MLLLSFFELLVMADKVC